MHDLPHRARLRLYPARLVGIRDFPDGKSADFHDAIKRDFPHCTPEAGALKWQLKRLATEDAAEVGGAI